LWRLLKGLEEKWAKEIPHKMETKYKIHIKTNEGIIEIEATKGVSW